MVKIPRKIITSIFLDGLFLIVPMALIDVIFKKQGIDIGITNGITGFLCVLIPLSLRDIVFRNASVGKLIVGVRVYDEYWKPPKFTKLIIRGAFMLLFALPLEAKYHFRDGDATALLDKEWELFRTRVVEVSVYKELVEKAKGMHGDFAKNMDVLYNDYLKSQPLD